MRYVVPRLSFIISVIVVVVMIFGVLVIVLFFLGLCPSFLIAAIALWLSVRISMCAWSGTVTRLVRMAISSALVEEGNLRSFL